MVVAQALQHRALKVTQALPSVVPKQKKNQNLSKGKMYPIQTDENSHGITTKLVCLSAGCCQGFFNRKHWGLQTLKTVTYCTVFLWRFSSSTGISVSQRNDSMGLSSKGTCPRERTVTMLFGKQPLNQSWNQHSQSPPVNPSLGLKMVFCWQIHLNFLTHPLSLDI